MKSIYGLCSCCVILAHQLSFYEAISFSLSQWQSLLSSDQLGLSGVFLKEEQLSAIKAVYEGHDVFVFLCYQTLPFLRSTNWVEIETFWLFLHWLLLWRTRCTENSVDWAYMDGLSGAMVKKVKTIKAIEGL